MFSLNEIISLREIIIKYSDKSVIDSSSKLELWQNISNILSFKPKSPITYFFYSSDNHNDVYINGKRADLKRLMFYLIYR